MSAHPCEEVAQGEGAWPFGDGLCQGPWLGLGVPARHGKNRFTHPEALAFPWGGRCIVLIQVSEFQFKKMPGPDK